MTIHWPDYVASPDKATLETMYEAAGSIEMLTAGLNAQGEAEGLAPVSRASVYRLLRKVGVGLQPQGGRRASWGQ